MPIQRHNSYTGFQNPGENYANAAHQGYRVRYLHLIVDEGVDFQAKSTQKVGCPL